MKTPTQPTSFDHQVFDLDVIGTALKDFYDRVATQAQGPVAVHASVLR